MLQTNNENVTVMVLEKFLSVIHSSRPGFKPLQCECLYVLGAERVLRK